MASRDSTLYTKLDVNKYLGDARDRGGRAVPVPFEHTVVAGGEAIADTVNLCVLPANCEVVGLDCITDGLGTSVTLKIGDSGDTDRYMMATAFASAEDSGKLAFSGMRYRPTAAATVFGTYAGGAATAAKIFRGVIWIVPGA